MFHTFINYGYLLFTQNAVEVPKVRMTVYFESLCSDTQRFFREQLTPTYSELSDIIDLQFVPFGKAIVSQLSTAILLN